MVVREVLAESRDQLESERSADGPGQSGIVATEKDRSRALQACVLVVHEDRDVAATLGAQLEPLGHRVLTARGLGPALEQALLEAVAVIVIDVEAPALEGLAVAARLRSFEVTHGVPLVMLAPEGLDLALVERSCEGGPFEVLVGPVDAGALRDTVSAFEIVWREHLFAGLEPAASAPGSPSVQVGVRSSIEPTRVAQDEAAARHEREQLLLERQQLRESLARVLGIAGLGMWELDPFTGQMTRDVRANALLGLPVEDTTFADFLLAVHADDRARVDAAFAATAGLGAPGGERPSIQLELRTAGLAGEPRWLMLRAELTGEGRQQRVSGVLGDITARRAEEERRAVLLLRANEAWAAAELASRAREERLQKVSHELRDPLHAVLGWSSFLLRSDARNDSTKLETGLRVIERQARAQVRMVDDILDSAGISAGKLSIRRGPVDVRTAVTEALRTSCLDAESKEIVLTARLDRKLGSVAGDEDRLRQIVANLLANAIKFTPQRGSVEVAARRVADGVTITVADTGEGIAPHLIPLVFDPYWQAKSAFASSSGYRGLGLGLTIVRHLVEQHGGTVSASSAGLGSGAAFEVWLPNHGGAATEGEVLPASIPPSVVPIAAPSSEPRSAPSSIPRRLVGRRIMIVDDERDIRELIGRILQRAGASVDKLATAEDAMEALERVTPDLVLSDLSLGHVDGFTFVRWIRSHHRRDLRALPVVAMTAHTFDDDPEALPSAGFQVHLVKPIHPHHLVDVVAGLTEGEEVLRY